MSLDNINKAKLTYQKIDTSSILKNTNTSGLMSLKTLLLSKVQDLKDKILTVLLTNMQKAGINITSIPPTVADIPDICPPLEILNEIIIIRNGITDSINKINDTLNIVTGTVTKASTILELALTIPEIISTVKSAISLGSKLIPSPPGVPGVITSALSDLEDVRMFLLFKSDGTAKLPELKNQIENISGAIDVFTAAITTILNLLNILDLLIIKCLPNTKLLPINNNLIILTQNNNQTNQSNSITQTYQYKGFTIKIVEVPYNDKILRRKAVGYNIQGIPLIETSLSFTTNPQVLIDELQLYIDKNNLKAY